MLCWSTQVRGIKCKNWDLPVLEIFRIHFKGCNDLVNSLAIKSFHFNDTVFVVAVSVSDALRLSGSLEVY